MEQLYTNRLDNLEEMKRFLETCNLPRQVRKQQLELDMEPQTGSKSGKQ